MTKTPFWTQANRMVEFARHMPLDKVARRLSLTVRRQMRDRLGGFASRTSPFGALEAYANPPHPLFPSRKGLAPVALSEGGWRFTILNRSIDMAGDMAAPAIDWLAPGDGAENQLWRMTLHYMEYLEGVSDDLFAAMTVDWIASNPLSRRGSWRDAWNSYTLSLRVVVWLQELARRRARLPEAVRDQIEASAVHQLRFLEKNLETDLGGNHLIKNIKALIWASAYFQGPEAAGWRQKGLRLLERELCRQILSDGMQVERSASYHAQVFADLLECRHALGGDPFEGFFDDTLAGMAQVIADLAHPDGGPALFNDAGLSMAYAPAACLAVFERIFGHRPVQRAVFSLPHAGYFGLRAGASYLIADCGRIAPDSLPAHGHGDVLSFEWSVGGHRFIVDPGVLHYHTGPLRQAARSAASHNTLCLEGADQADFFGAFRCGRRPNVELRRFEMKADGFVLEGAHDGFTSTPRWKSRAKERHMGLDFQRISHTRTLFSLAQLVRSTFAWPRAAKGGAHAASCTPGRPKHVRRFEATADSARIVDWIEGETDGAVRIGFLLHPDVSVALSGSSPRVARLTCAGVTLAVQSSHPMTLEAAAWWPDLGRAMKTNRIVIRVAAPVPVITTEFRRVAGDGDAMAIKSLSLVSPSLHSELVS